MIGGLVRAARRAPEGLRDGATYVAAAAGCLAVPALLDGLVHARSWAVYRLMWRNLVGHAYRMPIDTPKPLLVARAGLLGETAYFVAGILVFALLAVVFRRVSKALTGTGWPGLVAFVLVLVGNQYVLPNPFLTAYWPVVYFPLVAAGGWFFLNGSWDAAFAVVGLSGLLRPESWALVGVMLAVAAWRDPDRLRARHALALAAAPLWVAFDYLLAGDPLYSLHTLQRYRASLGAAGTPPGRYWATMLFDARQMFDGTLLAAGGLGMAAGLAGARRERQLRGHLYFAAVVLVPALGYWAVSWVSDVVLHVRFYSAALVVLYLYAVLAPLLLVRWTRRPGVLPAARGAGVEGRSGADAPGRGRGGEGVGRMVAAAWCVVALALGWRTGAWEEAREVSSDRARNQRARREAVEFLRRSWLEGGGSLLAGRSIEYLGLRLGEAASRRMHQYRMVAHSGPPLAELAPGYAVWIDGDVGGKGMEFSFLNWSRERRKDGVRFRRVAALVGDGGDTLGVVHRFREVEDPDAEPGDAPGRRDAPGRSRSRGRSDGSPSGPARAVERDTASPAAGRGGGGSAGAGEPGRAEGRGGGKVGWRSPGCGQPAASAETAPGERARRRDVSTIRATVASPATATLPAPDSGVHWCRGAW